jgi:flagellar biosynthesis protein FlhF
VIALVGPTGAGKTTTAAKIALSPHAFGSRKVGLLTLDTYRVGAIEQIRTYADVAGMPLEVVYQAREVRDALSRLARCEVIVVDTPGRGPRAANDEMEWREVLAAIAPDETHLVVPASVSFDFASHVRTTYEPTGVTHSLITKLDELPGEAYAVALADRLGLPARWVADGQEVPVDLRGAVQRILHALSQTTVNRRSSRAVA